MMKPGEKRKKNNVKDKGKGRALPAPAPAPAPTSNPASAEKIDLSAPDMVKSLVAALRAFKKVTERHPGVATGLVGSYKVVAALVDNLRAFAEMQPRDFDEGKNQRPDMNLVTSSLTGLELIELSRFERQVSNIDDLLRKIIALQPYIKADSQFHPALVLARKLSQAAMSDALTGGHGVQNTGTVRANSDHPVSTCTALDEVFKVFDKIPGLCEWRVEIGETTMRSMVEEFRVITKAADINSLPNSVFNSVRRNLDIMGSHISSFKLQKLVSTKLIWVIRNIAQISLHWYLPGGIGQAALDLFPRWARSAGTIKVYKPTTVLRLKVCEGNAEVLQLPEEGPSTAYEAQCGTVLPHEKPPIAVVVPEPAELDFAEVETLLWQVTGVLYSGLPAKVGTAEPYPRLMHRAYNALMWLQARANTITSEEIMKHYFLNHLVTIAMCGGVNAATVSSRFTKITELAAAIKETWKTKYPWLDTRNVPPTRPV